MTVPTAADVAQLEMLSAAVNDDFIVTEVIRPAAVLPELAARAILAELALRDVRAEGDWLADPSTWQRYDRPWGSPLGNDGESRQELDDRSNHDVFLR